MNEKEKMIDLTRHAFIAFNIVKATSTDLELIDFTFSKYYFYMNMLTLTYPDLDSDSLEREWTLENGRLWN